MPDKSALPSRDFIEITLAHYPAAFRTVYPDGKKSCRVTAETYWWSPYWQAYVEIDSVENRTAQLRNALP